MIDSLTPLRTPLSPIVLGATLALSTLVMPTAIPAAAAATTDGAYAGYYYSTAPGARITTLVVSSRPVCLSAEPLCTRLAYLVHPIHPYDWGTQQTAVVNRLSTQPLSVTFTAPCALSPCQSFTRPRMTLTLTLTHAGLHVDIVTGSLLGSQSHSSEDMTRLEFG